MKKGTDLLSLKVKIREAELANANKVFDDHLNNTCDMCKIVDAVYAMGRTMEERMGIDLGKKKGRKRGKKDENRRIRRLQKQVKESSRMVAWLSNKNHRRKIKRRAIKREKEY